MGDYRTSAQNDSVLIYMRAQAKDHGITTFDPTDDSFIAYVKHDWNDKSLGSWNCQTVQVPLRIVLRRLERQGLVERVESGYRLKE